MANKNRKVQAQQASQAKVKQQKYEAATKGLFIFPCISLGLCVITLLSFFANFVEIYLKGYGVEQSTSGWAFIAALLTNGYSNPLVSPSLANVFYVFATDWCEPLAIVTLFAALVLIVCVVVNLITIVRKMHALNLASAVLGLASAVLLIVCYAKGLDMKNANILSDFCGNNPNCSIQSYAIIPAIFALGATAVSAVATVKNIKAKNLLK